MKVPDKVYIAETPNKLIEIWSEEPIEPKPYITEHEYIRKDALMEWANSWLTFRKNGVILDDGFSYAMEELIKKLNSM